MTFQSDRLAPHTSKKLVSVCTCLRSMVHKKNKVCSTEMGLISKSLRKDISSEDSALTLVVYVHMTKFPQAQHSLGLWSFVLI